MTNQIARPVGIAEVQRIDHFKTMVEKHTAMGAGPLMPWQDLPTQPNEEVDVSFGLNHPNLYNPDLLTPLPDESTHYVRFARSVGATGVEFLFSATQESSVPIFRQFSYRDTGSVLRSGRPLTVRETADLHLFTSQPVRKFEKLRGALTLTPDDSIGPRELARVSFSAPELDKSVLKIAGSLYETAVRR